MDELESLFSAKDIASLQQESHTPLYHQMYLLLKNSICDGTLSYGTQLPTEYQLADTFKVSRITAKRALDDLSAEGLVERRRGKGTHVIYNYESPRQAEPPVVSDLHHLESIPEDTSVKVIDACFRQAPAKIKEAFDIDTNELLFNIIRTGQKNNIPFAYYTSWTVGLAGEHDPALLASASRTELLRGAGIHIINIDQTVSATLPTPSIAKTLDISPNIPILNIVQCSYDKKGKLVDRLEGFFHPERLLYKVNIKTDLIDNTQKTQQGIVETI